MVYPSIPEILDTSVFLISFFLWLFMKKCITIVDVLHYFFFNLIKCVFKLVKLALTPPRFIEVPVPTQESEHSCICVLGVTLCLFLWLFLLGIIYAPIMCYFFVFHFISHTQHSINMWHGRVCDRSGLWVVSDMDESVTGQDYEWSVTWKSLWQAKTMSGQWHGRVCDRSGLWVVMKLCVCNLVSVSMIFLLVFGAVPAVSTFSSFKYTFLYFLITVFLTYDFNWIVDLLNN